jgi:hypothetical protein
VEKVKEGDGQAILLSGIPELKIAASARIEIAYSEGTAPRFAPSVFTLSRSERVLSGD